MSVVEFLAKLLQLKLFLITTSLLINNRHLYMYIYICVCCVCDCWPAQTKKQKLSSRQPCYVPLKDVVTSCTTLSQVAELHLPSSENRSVSIVVVDKVSFLTVWQSITQTQLIVQNFWHIFSSLFHTFFSLFHTFFSTVHI